MTPKNGDLVYALCDIIIICDIFIVNGVEYNRSDLFIGACVVHAPNLQIEQIFPFRYFELHD